MLDAPKKPVVNSDRKPIVSYAKDAQYTGKFALPLAAVGFGYSILFRKSKIFYVLIGASLGFAIEAVVKSSQRL